jgi:serine/threonine protein kinase
MTKPHMSAVDWQKLNEAFAAAFPLDGPAQDIFLHQIENEDLRREAASLLASARRADAEGFLGTDAFSVGARILAGGEDEPPPAGGRVGSYRILCEVGRGGMGAVYLAEREHFRQRVALKVIKRGMDTDDIVRRFRRERQVLASLSHPHVARLLDGGATAEGAPFFVMEYVEGLPITKFCDRRGLSVEARLRLFRKVCAAVSYAHQNLVVHRDIKPSNILVTEDGEPRLLDFGISKLLASGDSETTAEQTSLVRLMTPDYASPEQVRGEQVTTAADVYSLGVLLYELLCGRRPLEFNNRVPAEILKLISEREPAAPSIAALTTQGGGGPDAGQAASPEAAARRRGTRPERLSRRLRGDLDNIVLTAVRKEPSRRYPSVEQFSEDVRRHLAGLPVSARSATLGYRVSKFVRRNRLPVAFASIALLAILAGLSVAVWQAHAARRERARAERQFNNVRRLANSLLTDFDEDLRNLPASLSLRLRLARASSDYLDGLAKESNDPVVMKELAEAHYRLGDAYAFHFSDSEEAKKHFTRSVEIARQLLAATPDDPAAKDLLARSLNTFGQKPSGWEEVFREVARLREEIVAVRPADPEALGELSGAYISLADLSRDFGRGEEALAHYGRALEARRRQAGLLERPDLTPDGHDWLYEAHLWIGIIQGNNFGDWQAALATFRKVVEIADAASAKFPDHRRSQTNVHLAHSWLAKALEENGDYQGALRQYDIALQSLKANSARYNLFAHEREIRYLLKTAAVLQKAGRVESSLHTVRRALDIRRAATAVDNKINPRATADHAYAFFEAGKLYAAVGKLDEARDASREAESYGREALEANPQEDELRSLLAHIYLHAGDLYAGSRQGSTEIRTREMWRLREAQSYYRKSVALFTAVEWNSILKPGDRENFRLASEKVRLVEEAMEKI